ncbi:N-acetyltransferase B complex non catalytic subunit-domain-containing protein [Hypoxylon cercidicola]|nr:N-acetyltransferase B complex non catalytic subunit-domain-containing protein [Hypoxylon cercidicola]
MKPPLINPGPRLVSLKPSTPTALQTAFSDGQWTNAANLAKQRHRATKDLYYLAIEVAAKSQSDNVADRSAGKALVESMVKDNVVITDVDTVDLIELSCSRVDIKYSETIGLLRAKLVKACPKDMNSCIRCFESCVYHSDWKNAQQIAASLNKNFTNDRNFLFHYLLATHMYSMSDECPQGSKKIFSSLVRAQADKAFDLRAMTAGTGYHIDRAVLTESEALLWLTIRMTHCTREENIALFSKPEYGPLAFLEVGFLRPYCLARRYLEQVNAWDDVFQLGKSILEQAIRMSQAEALAIENDETVISLRKAMKAELEDGQNSKESSVKKDLVRAAEKARPLRSLKDHSFFSASCEWDLFWSLYIAAKNHPDRKRLKKVQQLFHKMIKALTRAESMKPIFQRTYDLVTLQILFERESLSLASSGADASTARIVHLSSHLMKHSKEPQSFIDARELLKEMNKAEVAVFLSSLRLQAIKCTDLFQRLTLTCLALKLRYYVTTSSQVYCNCCHAVLEDPNCASCLQSIAANALNAYQSGMEDKNLRQNILPGENVDPLSDLAVIGAVSLLKLAGLGRWVAMKNVNSPLYHVNIALFLQAVLWLDSHVIASPPKNDRHRMLLVKLYLLMGCVSRAKRLWEEFDIKNAILDSLGLLYLDRLSSIAPGLFFSGSSYDNPIEPFTTHYTRAFKSTTPKWIMGSLEEGNYASVIDMISRTQKQSTSCTLVTTVLEERRGQRMKTGKVDTPIEDHPLVRKFSTELELQDVTDYSILSGENGDNFESHLDSHPIHVIVNYGPLPTNTRAHLGLLAERFLDFVCYVQPKEYKPSKAGQIIQLDLQVAVVTCANLKEDMKVLLGIANVKLSEEDKAKLARQRERALAALTKPESCYYNIVWRLAEMVVNVLGAKTISVSPNELRDRVRCQIEELTEVLSGQTSNFLAVPHNLRSKIHGFHGFGALHAMGMLRESTLAVKHTASYLATASEKVKNIDKTRPATEMAWLAPELKRMTAAAAESETMIKARIKRLKSYLDDVDGWRDRLCDWTFGEYITHREDDREFKKEMSEKLKAVVPKANAEVWADHVGDSWRQLMKGWAAVKFD